MIMNNFLAATGIEDIGNALNILEQNNWDLLASVSSVIPQDFQSSPVCPPQPRPHPHQEQPTQHVPRPPVGDEEDFASPLLRYPQQDLRPPGNDGDFIGDPLSVTRHHRTAGPDMPLLPPPIAHLRTDAFRTTTVQPLGITDDEKIGPVRNISGPTSLEPTDRTVMEETRSDQVCHYEKLSLEGVHKDSSLNGCNESDDDGSEYYSPVEEFEHEIEEESGDNSLPTAVKHGALIPEECTDPQIALQLFTSNFEQRYGGLHPLFYIGSLAEALKEASSPLLPTSRKPLLVYLHHDRSILSNIFCSQLLCAESVVNLLSANYISWGWDLTSDAQKRKLLEMVKDSFGEQTASSVESVKSDHLPVILLVCKVGGRLEVQNIIQGHTDLETFMGHLLTCMEVHGEQVQRDNIEEQARIERERMIEEQDRRYRESLEADRLKEEKRMEAERLKVEEQELKEAERRRCSNAVPLEPDEDYNGKMAKVRFRCPNGETMMRRFRAEETLGMLLNYLGSQSYPVGNYKLLTSFPRRDISELDPDQTLDSLGLCPQATLFIEEK